MIGKFVPKAPRPLSYTDYAKRTWYTPERTAQQAQNPSSMLLPGAFPSPTALAKIQIGPNGQTLVYTSKTFGRPA